jgi:hypothetical protein
VFVADFARSGPLSCAAWLLVKVTPVMTSATAPTPAAMTLARPPFRCMPKTDLQVRELFDDLSSDEENGHRGTGGSIRISRTKGARIRQDADRLDLSARRFVVCSQQAHPSRGVEPHRNACPYSSVQRLRSMRSSLPPFKEPAVSDKKSNNSGLLAATFAAAVGVGLVMGAGTGFAAPANNNANNNANKVQLDAQAQAALAKCNNAQRQAVDKALQQANAQQRRAALRDRQAKAATQRANQLTQQAAAANRQAAQKTAQQRTQQANNAKRVSQQRAKQAAAAKQNAQRLAQQANTAAKACANNK